MSAQQDLGLSSWGARLFRFARSAQARVTALNSASTGTVIWTYGLGFVWKCHLKM